MNDSVAEKENPAPNQEIDQILDSIKDTMNNAEVPDDNILELTEEIKYEEAENNADQSEKLGKILEDEKEEVKNGKGENDNARADDLINKIDSVKKDAGKLDATLISNEIANKSRGALKNLLDQANADESPKLGKQTSLEEITKELLRPYLSEWLNENLHSVVERVVQKEIKKILPND